jgi:hypothetical protein
VLGYGEVIGAGWSLGEHAYLVDEVRNELAPADFEYLDGLARGLERGPVTHLVASRTVAIYHLFPASFASGTSASVTAREVKV